ncbi:effector-associated constant component EACC1 [Streptomyces sp. NBC_00063]|uniref:effector-associated constant component EACC1 n=1 Tax=Streptomyces sp. NBC_00063 TaxID=2975638 RepID=UPI003D70FF40
MMQIRMDGPGADQELRSLRTWLLETPAIRQHAKVSWAVTAPQHEEMGAGALDTLQLITDNFWQITTFSLSYAAWRKTRTRSPRVTIECNGKTVTIEGGDDEAVERLIQALTEE